MSEWKRFKLTIEDEIASVVFNDSTSTVNTLNMPTIREMEEVLAAVREGVDNGSVKAMTLISGKPKCFIVGKDMKDTTPVTKDEAAEQLMQIHRLFLAIDEFPVPTVVGVKGFCLGGGFEFALSFDARVAKEDPKTLFGFPEIGLGIFPGSGGTQRFPRLLGAEAVKLIMSGEKIKPGKALKLGAVDRVIGADEKLSVACKALAREIIDGSVKLERAAVSPEEVVTAVNEAEQAIIAQGREPAPNEKAALNAIGKGIEMPLWDGICNEAALFGQLTN